jgi:hypothetical protein
VVVNFSVIKTDYPVIFKRLRGQLAGDRKQIVNKVQAISGELIGQIRTSFLNKIVITLVPVN